ncbi:hypothetical protein ABID22_003603 [Pontibacter aydingkolensis]|uniref:hypothetical protein n=1 Tax=Pontibacter aydingkolensis TaxID=1911536 RepID=UPI003390F77B
MKTYILNSVSYTLAMSFSVCKLLYKYGGKCVQLCSTFAQTLTMQPYSYTYLSLLALTGAGLVSASHHLSLSDKLNGYCLHFFTTPKAFNG